MLPKTLPTNNDVNNNHVGDVDADDGFHDIEDVTDDDAYGDNDNRDANVKDFNNDVVDDDHENDVEVNGNDRDSADVDDYEDRFDFLDDIVDQNDAIAAGEAVDQ